MIMESNSIGIEISCHQMTAEEVKQEKLEAKERNKKYRQEKKEKRKESRQLRNNFITFDKCMISPKNIQIGSLEKCIYSKMVESFSFMGSSFGHIDEKYEPIEGEKVLIKISDEYDYYFELDKVNTLTNLCKIRKGIAKDGGIYVNGELISCYHGKIRIDEKTLQAHPLFEEVKDEKISLRKVKQMLAK